MILTVTCNPAVDVTYLVDAIVPGDVHRVREVRQLPGGKGVNAARVLHEIGEDVVALGLADAGFGRSVEALGVAADFLDVLPSVRRTEVVQHGATTTSLWEPGWPVAECAAESLTDLVGGADALVVSGACRPASILVSRLGSPPSPPRLECLRCSISTTSRLHVLSPRAAAC